MAGNQGGNQLGLADILREHRTRIKNLEAADVGGTVEWEDVGGGIGESPIRGWYSAGVIASSGMYTDPDGYFAPEWDSIANEEYGGDATGISLSGTTGVNSYVTIASTAQTFAWLMMWGERGAGSWPPGGTFSPLFTAESGMWNGVFEPIQSPRQEDVIGHTYVSAIGAMCFASGYGSLRMLDQTATGGFGQPNFFAFKLHKTGGS